jgi:hypothetical protein
MRGMKLNKSTIIIRKDDSISDFMALEYVQYVICSGRISSNGKSYCRATQFANDIIVYADKKKSDIFYVIQLPNKKENENVPKQR